MDGKTKSVVALQFQQLLMVEHIQQCAQWGLAVKRIITSTKPETTPSTISDELKTTPATTDNDPPPAAVQFFQPVSIDAPPLPPPVTEGNESIVSGIPADVAKKPVANSEPTSLLQKLKSRILHV